MLDMNLIIANNIQNTLKTQGKKQVELADGIGVSKQMISKMLSGTRMIHAAELNKISEFLGVSMDSLAKIPAVQGSTDLIHAFMGRVASREAREALRIADQISDMILFHSRVRENGAKMMQPWEEA